MVQPKNSPTNSDDEYCGEHGYFYELDARCPGCSAKKTHTCNTDGECSRHRNYHCTRCGTCPQCEAEREMSKTAKARKNVCDYCDQPAHALEKLAIPTGGTMTVCKQCIGAIKGEYGEEVIHPVAAKPAAYTPDDVKSCGCIYDGETASYCTDHDRYYCTKCTDERDICPVCDLFDEAVEQRAELPRCDRHPRGDEVEYCQDHQVWYCGGCHPICPRCQVDAVESSVKDARPAPKALPAPSNYPLISCYSHGWFCSRCDKDCPSCHTRGRWEIPKCKEHKNHYCPRCGMGCKDCGKRKGLSAAEPKAKADHVLECPACRKVAFRYCDAHGYFCTECDGVCMKCDGAYSRGGVTFHKCGKKMAQCLTHNKHFCLGCGQKCKLCVSDRKHRCGAVMSCCKRHDITFCKACNIECSQCDAEAAFARKKQKHHCGCPMLMCARHDTYFCPSCDYLCKCSIDCGVVEKHGTKDHEYRGTENDIEWQWGDFQIWLKNREEFVDCVKDFKENWDEMMRFLFPKLLVHGGDPTAEEACEKLMAVDTCLKALIELCVKMGTQDAELEEEVEENPDDIDVDDDVDAAINRSYGGSAYWDDEYGRRHHFYRDDDDHPTFVKVTITDEGDDLSVGVKTTKFTAIVIENNSKK